MERQILDDAVKMKQEAINWLNCVSRSNYPGDNSNFRGLARRTMDQYTLGVETGEPPRLEFDAWINAFNSNVHSHLILIHADITQSYRAFRNQLWTGKNISDVGQFLPSLSVAYTRSVGVMLDASVRVRFGGMIRSFNSIYMRVVKVNPNKVLSDHYALVEDWSRVHEELLGILRLRDTFLIGLPSVEEVAKEFGTTIPTTMMGNIQY